MFDVLPNFIAETAAPPYAQAAIKGQRMMCAAPHLSMVRIPG